MAITGLCNDRVSMPSARAKSHLELVARWGPMAGGSQALERRPAQCAGKMLEVETVDLGSHGESGQLCGQSQTMECSPHPMGHPTLPAPCSEAEGAEGSPAW